MSPPKLAKIKIQLEKQKKIKSFFFWRVPPFKIQKPLEKCPLPPFQKIFKKIPKKKFKKPWGNNFFFFFDKVIILKKVKMAHP